MPKTEELPRRKISKSAEPSTAAYEPLARCGRNVRQLQRPFETLQLSLDRIQIDAQVQSRTSLNEETVAEYAEAYAAGEDLPAVIVFREGNSYLVADGFHRVAALRSCGVTTAQVCAYEGTRQDALLYAAGANVGHGLPRTQEDKRNAVRMVCEHPDCKGWSNVQIAEWVGVSDKTAAKWRTDLDRANPLAVTRFTTADGEVRQRKATTSRAERRPNAEAAAPSAPATSVITMPSIGPAPAAIRASDMGKAAGMPGAPAPTEPEFDASSVDETIRVLMSLTAQLDLTLFTSAIARNPQMRSDAAALAPRVRRLAEVQVDDDCSIEECCSAWTRSGRR